MSVLLNQVKHLAAELKEEVIAHRRHLHAHPELSFEEVKTSNYVAGQLDAMGLPYTRNVGGHGIVVVIEGNDPASKVVALRADMDALPILEANDVPYKSTNPGVMHACGHDAHTASMLGAAKILKDVKHKLTGSIKLIFQPAEEKTPGGASLMIKDGVLLNPSPTAIIGQHVQPFLPAGKVGFREGMYMASADEIYITIKGKGGHGAMPEKNIDPVVAAAQVITSLQAVISRYGNPRIPSVLSVGKVIANGATNVIPNEVYMEGTFRTMDEPWRYKAHEHIKRTIAQIAEAYGCSAEIDLQVGYPYLKNDPALTQLCKAAAQDYLGEENVEDLDIWMAAEDFSWYTQQVPGCFYRLGTRNEERGIIHSVHTPKFDIEENALEVGAGLMAYMAVTQLSK